MVLASIQDHKQWLLKADEDVQAMALLIKRKNLSSIVAYHAQQAAEKILKAFMVYHQKQVKRTHDLSLLLEECVKIDFTFVQLKGYATTLTIYATYTRYPDDWFTIDHAEAKEAQKKATFIVNFVMQRVT